LPVKVPVPLPAIVILDPIVGVIPLLQHIPLSTTVSEPSSTTIPEPTAVVSVILDIGKVVTTGTVDNSPSLQECNMPERIRKDIPVRLIQFFMAGNNLFKVTNSSLINF
jgi:hypothetical protein